MKVKIMCDCSLKQAIAAKLLVSFSHEKTVILSNMGVWKSSIRRLHTLKAKRSVCKVNTQPMYTRYTQSAHTYASRSQ